MIIVTGGAGFIGSNLVRALCARGEREVVVVDDLSDGRKFTNLVDCDIADYIDKDAFRAQLANPHALNNVRAVLHQGACSDTTEWDGRFMMDSNFEYSKLLLHACCDAGVPFIYASSAAVYGVGREFAECVENERPVNMYGYSKLCFDRYVRRYNATNQVVGLRYFNVYGPGEAHKDRMASVVLHFHRQLSGGDDHVRLFAGSHGYGDGEQQRDFVHVDDVVAVNLWFLDHPQRQGIFNVGTGRGRSFNAVAEAVIRWHGRGAIRYVPFPDDLNGRYQAFTQADLSALQAVGLSPRMRGLDDGVPQYLEWLRIHDRALSNH